MLKSILERIFKNWKSTTAGVGIAASLIGAAATVYKPGMNWKTYVIALFIAIAGAAIKDNNLFG